MLLINCPWCGDRAETEFSYGGEGGIQRPLDPDALSDAEWADYLFNRSNPRGRGAHRELWNHSQGCRRWFGVDRDTVSYAIERSYALSAAEQPGES
jgi:sarcosine oxidase subunit delta